MKSILVALLSIGSSALAMTNMPGGVYQGQGRWNDNQGRVGSYNVTTTVTGGTVSSTYTFNDQTESFTFEAKEAAAGRFDVLVGGEKIGEGYCMSVQCHYVTELAGTNLEETLTFYEGHLYRIGSKRVEGKIVTWEEAMAKQED
ncbi:MAG: hypothetical protein AB7G93_05845 [Bdellovibrionales bacterium]